jgi:hypothetical protein
MEIWVGATNVFLVAPLKTTINLTACLHKASWSILLVLITKICVYLSGFPSGGWGLRLRTGRACQWSEVLWWSSADRIREMKNKTISNCYGSSQIISLQFRRNKINNTTPICYNIFKYWRRMVNEGRHISNRKKIHCYLRNRFSVMMFHMYLKIL